MMQGEYSMEMSHAITASQELCKTDKKWLRYTKIHTSILEESRETVRKESF